LKQFIGTSVEIPTTNFQFDYESTQISQKTMIDKSKYLNYQPTITYNPQLQIASPNAQMGGSTVTPSITVIPTKTQETGQTSNAGASPDMGIEGGSTGLTDLLIVGGVLIAGVLILPKLMSGIISTKTGRRKKR